MCCDRDHISPTTLRIEFGLANEMKQYEEKCKVRKILGDINSKGHSTKETMFSSLTSTFSSTNTAVTFK